MSVATIINEAPKRFRAAPSRGAKPRVDRTGGDYGAGVIYGVSFVSEGEALGHRMWLDTAFVASVNEEINASGQRGKKMRFTHPSLSGDGMGSFLGRGKNSRIEGGKAVADLHFSKSSHKTPDGDLATYVMDMAEEDPDAFGVSIVFSSDLGAEDRFVATNSDEDGNFRSPDKRNSKNYRHARLARLHAADVVDDPAANPDGLFRRDQSIAEEADKLCSFALGLSDERPELAHLSVDPDRTAAFVARFLESHDLELKGKTMSEENKGAAPAALSQEALDAVVNPLKAKIEELESKLSAAPTPPSDGEPTQAEIEARGAKRASDIFDFAATSGLADHAKLAKEAIDKGLSLESFKASLTDRLIAKNGLTEDGGQPDADPYAKFRAEYNADRALFTANGVKDVEAYIRTRCRDEGIEPPPAK